MQRSLRLRSSHVSALAAVRAGRLAGFQPVKQLLRVRRDLAVRRLHDEGRAGPAQRAGLARLLHPDVVVLLAVNARLDRVLRPRDICGATGSGVVVGRDCRLVALPRLPLQLGHLFVVQELALAEPGRPLPRRARVLVGPDPCRSGSPHGVRGHGPVFRLARRRLLHDGGNGCGHNHRRDERQRRCNKPSNSHRSSPL